MEGVVFQNIMKAHQRQTDEGRNGGGQGRAENPHPHFGHKHIVKDDVKQIASDGGNHHQFGVVIRPDDHLHHAGEDKGEAGAVDGGHILGNVGHQLVGGPQEPGKGLQVKGGQHTDGDPYN